MKRTTKGFYGLLIIGVFSLAILAGCGTTIPTTNNDDDTTNNDDNTTTDPAAPTSVTATAGDGQVTISWSAVSDATSYNVYWSATTGVTKTNGTKISGTTSPYIHASLTNDTTYYYIVTAVSSYGESVESAQASATPSLFSGIYTGSWTNSDSGNTASGTFTTTLDNGVFTDTIFTITSGNFGILFTSGTVSSSGAITGTGIAPAQCSGSVGTFTGQITTTSSGDADMTMTYSRPASAGGCEAESGTITATRL